MRRVGDEELLLYDIPWEGRNIWGATAGMLLTFVRMLQAGRVVTDPEATARKRRWRACSKSCAACALRTAVVPGTGQQDFARHRALHHRRGLRSCRRHRARRSGRHRSRTRRPAVPGGGSTRRWARSAAGFDFASVADAISSKLTTRHPHVFGDAKIASVADQNRALGRTQGARERAARPERAPSALTDVPLALPAIVARGQARQTRRGAWASTGRTPAACAPR